MTRRDLSPGQQATQSTHAAFLFSVEHPLIMERWYRESTYLVLLTVPDEEALALLTGDLRATGLLVSLWREPDLSNEITAIAIEPGASRLVANLPLTLREPAMT